jgi:hypothetical protein
MQLATYETGPTTVLVALAIPKPALHTCGKNMCLSNSYGTEVELRIQPETWLPNFLLERESFFLATTAQARA